MMNRLLWPKLWIGLIVVLEAVTFVWNILHLNDVVLQYGWVANFR